MSTTTTTITLPISKIYTSFNSFAKLPSYPPYNIHLPTSSTKGVNECHLLAGGIPSIPPPPFAPPVIRIVFHSWVTVSKEIVSLSGPNLFHPPWTISLLCWGMKLEQCHLRSRSNTFLVSLYTIFLAA